MKRTLSKTNKTVEKITLKLYQLHSALKFYIKFK